MKENYIKSIFFDFLIQKSRNLFFVFFVFSFGLAKAQVPSITGINPKTAFVGQTITISGTGFDATVSNNIVWIGSVKANITSASSTKLEVNIPTGISYAPVLVLNKISGLLGRSEINTISFSPLFFGNNSISSRSFSKPLINTPVYNFPQTPGFFYDLDSDGRPDYISAQSNTLLGVYQNLSTNGNVDFNSVIGLSMLSFAGFNQLERMNAGDLDGDGKPEIVTPTPVGNRIAIFKNNSTVGTITSSSFSFGANLTITGGLTSFADIELVDIEKDGKLDIIAGGAVFRNISTIGNLQFEPCLVVDNSSPTDIQFADLNGDGKAEYICHAGSNIRIYENNSTPTTITAASFLPFITVASATDIRDILVYDVDGDSKNDILVNCGSSAVISLLHNKSVGGTISAGTFAAKVDISTAGGFREMAAGDFDSDGKIDLIEANQTGFFIRKNNAVGSTITGTTFASSLLNNGGTGNALGPHVLDIDGDGLLDVANTDNGPNLGIVLGQNHFDVLPNKGFEGNIVTLLGTNLPSVTGVKFGTTSVAFTISGANILVSVPAPTIQTLPVVLQNSVFTQTGNDFTYLFIPSITGISPQSGDPNQEMTITGNYFSANRTDNLVWFGGVMASISNASATQLIVKIPYGATYSPISVINLKSGLQASSKNNFTPVFIGSRSVLGADFSNPTSYTTGTNPTGLAVADIDLDGNNDIIVSNAGSSSISIFRNLGTSFAAKVDFAMGVSTPSGIAVGDIDGDGRPDIACVNQTGGIVSVFKNTAVSGIINASSLAPKVDFVVGGTNSRSVVLADLDLDGRLDLSVTNASLNQVVVLRNICTTTTITALSFEPPFALTNGTNAVQHLVADIDGNGIPEIVVVNSGSSNVSVWRNTNNTTTLTASNFILSSSAVLFASVGLALADVDGDSKLDLLVCSGSSTNFSAYRNQSVIGAISFATGVSFTAPSFGTSISVTDLNGDGKPDVVLGVGVQSCISVYQNTATTGVINASSFVPESRILTGVTNRNIIAADIDKDGKSDLIDISTNLRIRKNNVIISSSPIAALVGGVTSIFGSNFTSATRVFFNPNQSALFTSISNSIIVATVPSGAITGPLTITNEYTTSSGGNFNLALPISISGFSPRTGNLGNYISIAGANLNSINAISFNGISASFFYDTKSTALFATVPTSILGSYRISMQNLISTETFSGYNFTVVSLPKITDFNPKSAFPNQIITIVGLNFDPIANQNLVVFGTLNAIPISGNSTQLLVRVPNGAKSGNIEVKSGRIYARSVLPLSSKFIGNPTFSGFSFEPPNTSPAVTVSNLRNGEVGDMDGDGKIDIVSAGVGGAVVNILQNTTSGTNIGFRATQTFTPSVGVMRDANIGDINGDGKPDMLVLNYNSTTSLFSVFKNTSNIGNLSMAASVSVAGGNNQTAGCYIADVDGDGKKDLIVGSTTDNTLRIYLNKTVDDDVSEVSFASPVLYTYSSLSEEVYIADLDGDGKPEIITSTNFQFNIRYNLSTIGNIQFGNNISFSPTDSPEFIAFKDLDADNKPEMVISNTSPSITNNIAVYKNNANPGTFIGSNFAAPVYFPISTNPTQLDIEDVNGDNKPDIVVAGAANLVVLGNVGTPGVINTSSFSVFTHSVTTAGSAWGMRVADLNLDHKPDMVMAQNASPYLLVRNNSTIEYSTSSGIRGQRLSIIGTNFEEVNQVVFSTNVGANFQIVNANLIVCTVPSLANTGNIRVSNDFTTSTGTVFTVILTPTFTGLNPSFGTVGNTVNISGLSLASVSTLLGNGISIPFSYNSTTLGISFTIPQNQANGVYSIVGSNFLFASNIIVFNVVSRPTITGFAPQSAFPGEEVTISGFGFAPVINNNQIRFGNVVAQITFASTTQLIALVPQSPQQGEITALNLETSLSDRTIFPFTPQFIGSNTLIGTNFAPAFQLSLPVNSTVVQIVDIDGDGLNDIYACPNGSIFRNVSNSSTLAGSSFATRVDLPFSFGTNNKWGDIDNDGKLDLIVGTTSGIWLYRNTSSPGNIAAGDFEPGVYIPIFNSLQGLNIIDLDKDGKLDVVMNVTGSQLRALRNIGFSGQINANTFAPISIIGVGALNNSIEFGDLNNDGKPEIVHAGSSASVFGYHNFSHPGTFSFVGFTLASPANSTSVAIADLDGDNKLDIISGNAAAFNYTVYKNIHVTGTLVTGSFNAGVNFATGGIQVQSIYAQDIDGDNKIDMVTSPNVGGNIFFFRNTHAGGAFNASSFASPFTVNSGGSNSVKIDISDLEGDGRPDIVAANSGTSNFSIIRNISNISFSPTSGLTGNNVTVFGSNLGRAAQTIFKGTSGTFNTLSGYVLTVNVPLCATTGLLQARNQFYTTPGSTFTVIVPPTITGVNPISGPVGQSVTISGIGINSVTNLSVNGFGISIQTIVGENLVFNIPNSLTSGLIMVQNPAGTANGFTFTLYRAPTITGIVAAYSDTKTLLTINGLGFNPVASENIVRFEKMSATPTSATATRLILQVPLGVGFGPVIVQDLISGLVARTIYTTNDFSPSFIGSNTLVGGNFGLPVTITGVGSQSFTESVDIDGDGWVDLAVSNTTGTVSVFRNLGTSSISGTMFAPRVDLNGFSSVASFAFADVDADGKPELLVINSTLNTIVVLKNISSIGSIDAGSFATGVSFATNTTPNHVAAGDIDGDGRPELLVVSTGTPRLSILRNICLPGIINTNSFEPRVDITLTNATNGFISLADLDADGKLDVVIRGGAATTSLNAFRNTATMGTINGTSFAAPTALTAGASPRSVQIADINADGKPEIVCVNQAATTASVFPNNCTIGVFSFGAAVNVNFATAANTIRIADMDGDSKPDFVTNNFTAGTITVVRNVNPSVGAAITPATFVPFFLFPAGTNPQTLTLADFDNDGRIDISTSLNLTNTHIFTNLSAISLTPSIASVGTQVTIVGSDFATTNYSVTSVLFSNGVSAPFTINNSSLILTTVPGGAISGLVTVTNGFTSSTAAFFVPALPSITGVNPISGPVGQSVTISGVNIAGVTNLSVNGLSMAINTIIGESLIFIVPNSLTSGLVVVSNSFGTSSGFSFTLYQAPTITGIAQAYSDTKSILTINGFGFNTVAGQNLVRFDKITTSILGSTANQMTVRVPLGAAFGPLQIQDMISGLISRTVFTTNGFSPLFIGSNTLTANNFNSAIPIAGVGTLNFTETADVDGDGWIDFITCNSAGTVSIFRNLGTGSFTGSMFATVVDFNGFGNATSVAFYDMDADGKPEMLITNATGNTVNILKNQSSVGIISFAAAVSYATNPAPQHVQVGDLDGDGRPDMVVANSTTPRLSMFRNIGLPGVINTASFEPRFDITLTNAANAFVDLADLNDDGKLDIAVRGGTTTFITNLYRNTFTGIGGLLSTQFSSQTTLSAGTTALHVQNIDINEDGKPDAITVNNTPSAIVVYRNGSTAGGPFGHAGGFSFTTTGTPLFVRAADLNGDSKPDLVVTNSASAAITIFMNTNTSPGAAVGASTFAPPFTISGITATKALSLADFDNDGRIDLAVSNNVTATNFIRNVSAISILPNATIVGTQISIVGSNFGTPNYSVTSVAFAPSQSAPFSIVNSSLLLTTIPSGAISGLVTVTNGFTSSNSDITVLNPPTVTSFNPNSGGFGQAVSIFGQNFIGVTFVGFGDRNSIFSFMNSTLISTFVSQAVPGIYPISVANGQGSFTFSGYNYTVVSPPIITDFNPKYADPGREMTITGTGFSAIPSQNVVVIGGIQNSITGSNSTSIRYLVSNGNNTNEINVSNLETELFSSSQRMSNFPKYFSQAFIGSNSINDQNFSVPITFTGGNGPNAAISADIDGDGYNDLIVGNYNGGNFSIFRNNGLDGLVTSASFMPKVDFASGTNPTFVELGDLDLDGKIDLVVSNQGLSTISIFKNNAIPGVINAASFSPKIDLVLPGNAHSLTLGDVDLDGKLDIIGTNYSTNQVSIFRNLCRAKTITGSSFAPIVNFTAQNLPALTKGIHDLDGDGKPEIIIANDNAGSVSVYRNISTIGTITSASFATRVDYTSGTNCQNPLVADIDGDGKPEIIANNRGANSISVFRNQTSIGVINGGSFVRTLFSPTGTDSRSMIVNDVNGDNKPDILLSDLAAKTVAVYKNNAISGIINSSSFDSPYNYTFTGPMGIFLSDINKSGKPNLIVANFGLNIISIYNNLSTISYSTTTTSANQQISILGSNFANANYSVTSVVFANGINSQFSILNSQLILVTVPSSAVSGQVIVTNGFSTAVGPNLLIQQVPSILGFNPRIGALGNLVSIAGFSNGFALVTFVGFNGFSAPFTYNSLTGSIFANVPTTILGLYAINVRSQLGSNTFSGYNYTVVSPPIITDFNPKIAYSGEIVTLIGSGFDNTSSNNRVWLGGAICSVTGASATQLLVSIPTRIGKGQFTVQNTVTGLSAKSRLHFVPKFIGSNLISSSIAGLSFEPMFNVASSGSAVVKVAFADLDGDGNPDMITSHEGGGGSISIRRNTAILGTINGSSFGTAFSLAVPGAIRYVVTDDLDGDGKLDLAINSPTNNNISIFKNISSIGTLDASSFAAVVTIPSAPSPVWIASGDLDGDGKIDLACTNPTSNVITLYRNMGLTQTITSSSFSPPITIVSDLDRNSIEIYDMDGDGKSDVVVSGGFNATDAISLYHNISTIGTLAGNSFAPYLNLTTHNSPAAHAIADIDGDGKLDIGKAAAGFGNTSGVIWTNQSTIGTITGASFGTMVDYNTNITGQTIEFADLNGDGKLDYLVPGYLSRFIGIYQNQATIGGINSASMFNRQDYATPANEIYSADAFDIDGDQRSDLITANYAANSVGVWRNINTISYNISLVGIGQVISVFGSNMNDVTQLFFSANINAPFSIINSQLIVTTVPSSAISGAIRVYGVFYTAVGLNLNVINPAQIISFAPTSGPTGTLITLSCTGNVNLVTSVGFNGLLYPVSTIIGNSIQVVNLNSIAGSQLVGLAGSEGFTTFGGYNFTVVSSPIITDFNPKIADAGRQMTIIGSNFGTAGANRVQFGAVYGQIISSTSTEIILTIPKGAQHGMITVLNTITGLQGHSDIPFILDNFTPVHIGSHTITSSNFAPSVNYAVPGANAQGVIAADINGDNLPELIVAVLGSNYILVFENLGVVNTITGSSFGNAFTYGTLAPVSLFASDLNGDGRLDIATANNGGTISVFYNAGVIGSLTANSLSPAVNFTAGTTTRDIKAADMDGDGLPEIMAVNVGSSTLSVFHNRSILTTITSASFAPRFDFTTGSSPNSLSIGDFDDDGKIDIVIANQVSSSLSFYRNTATLGTITGSSLAARVDFSTANGPRQLVVGDLDGDGSLDVATSANAGNVISVFRNLGVTNTITSISFATRLDYSTGAASNPSGLVLVDIDGDSKLDIATSSAAPNSVLLLRNRSTVGVINSSSFSPFVMFNATGTVQYLSTSDLDQDGKTDLIATSITPNNLSIFKNISTISYVNSIGGLGSVATIRGSNFSQATQVRFAPNNLASFIINNSSLIITTVPSGAIAGPITVTNGFTTAVGADFIIPSAPSISEFNPTSGPIGTRITLTGSDFQLVTSVGFNGINSQFSILNSQFIVAFVPSVTGINQISVQNNVGGFTFGGYNFTVVSPPIITDFNPKFASQGQEITIIGMNFASNPSQGVVFVGAVRGSITGGNTTTLRVVMPSSTGYFPITYHHLTNNLIAESSTFITPTFVGTNTITSGQFTRVDLSVGTNPLRIRAADFDLDGKPDLLIGRNSGTIMVGLNTTSNYTITGSDFPLFFPLTTSASQQSVSFADFNGDGSLDVAAAITGNSIGIYQNLITTPGFGSQIPLTISSSIIGLEIADFDSDGKQDIIYANNTANQLYIYKNIHIGNSILGSSFLSTFTIAGVNSPTEIQKADFDGDGKLDISFVNVTANNFSVYRNNSSIGTLSGASFDAIQSFATGTSPQNFAIGDIDGDAKLDVVVANSSSNSISVYRNTSSIGAISFAAKVDFSTASSPLGVTIGDLNGDGKPEVVVSNNTSNTISIFRNTATIGVVNSSSLAAKIDLATLANPRKAVICDIDADGKADIVVPNSGTLEFSIFKNNVSLITNLAAPTLSGNAFCSGDVMNITYSGTGAFDFGNNFLVEVSAPNGTFPGTTFATIAGTALNGVLTVTAPSLIQSSTYRLRLRASSPSTISPDNGVNLVFSSVPTITGFVSANYCQNSQIQLVVLTAGGITGYSWTHNGLGSFDNNAIQTPIYTPVANETGTVIFNMTPLGVSPCLTNVVTLTSTIQTTVSAIVYVNATATGLNNGTSWSNAYTDLQSALSASTCGTQIWVASGTYKPTNGADRTISFQLKKGVSLFGGFNGTETELLQRNLSLSGASLLSGDIGTGGLNTDNSYHVIQANDVDANTLVDGFSIAFGNASGGGTDELIGAGLLAKPQTPALRANPTLRNVIFNNNIAGMFGGAIYAAGTMLGSNANVKVENGLFYQNNATAFGSAVFGETNRMSITSSTFSNNIASGTAAIFFSTIVGNNSSIRNSIIYGNSPSSNQINFSNNVTYSIVEGGFAGTGNSSSDPLFINAGSNNYRLQAGSPAINAGTITGAPATDIVQSLRGCVPDMGAYEFAQNNVGFYDNIWIGCTSTNWATASNWSANRVPLASDNVYIPGTDVIVTQPQINTASEKCYTISLDVINGANLIIAPGGDLEITKP